MKRNIIAILAELAFIIVIAYLFSIVNVEKKPEAKIAITNFDSTFANLPTDTQTLIEQSLYQIASKNNSNDTNLPIAGALIDTNNITSTYFSKTDIHYINFLVNVPELNQTYQIAYDWSDNKNNSYILANSSLYAFCPKNNNFNCKDNNNNFTPEVIIYNFTLNYPFEGFIVKPNLTYNNLSFDIKLSTNSNLTSDNATNALKNFIEQLGFDSTIYTYNI